VVDEADGQARFTMRLMDIALLQVDFESCSPPAPDAPLVSFRKTPFVSVSKTINYSRA
jgi:hypothetical protein